MRVPSVLSRPVVTLGVVTLAEAFPEGHTDTQTWFRAMIDLRALPGQEQVITG